MKVAFRNGFEQCEVVGLQNSLLIIRSNLDGAGNAKVVEREEWKFNETPLDLTKDLSEDDVRKLKELFEQIITRKVPVPSQISNLLKLSASPDDVRTQAILKFCSKSECLCPLFYTIGCVELLDNPIVANLETSHYVHNPQRIVQRKCIEMIMHSLRQKISWSEFMTILNKIKEREETEDVLVERYKEVGEELV